MLNSKEIQILRNLAQRYAQIAALPVHAEKRNLWRDNNEFRSARPMVLIDQICWEQVNIDGSLNLQIQDLYWKGVEKRLRKTLYCWEHIPVDMVINPYISIPKPLIDSGWGIDSKVDLGAPAVAGGVHGQYYHDVLEDEESLDRIRMPEFSLDPHRVRQIQEEADVIFDGIIPYVMEGHCLHLGVWDKISQWHGVENCYFDLIDRPEFLHALMEKLTQGLLSQIESLNRLKAYDVTSNIVHCSHLFLDDLPDKSCDPNNGTTHQGWGFGLAQLFSSVSPAVTKEFEVEYMNRVFPHFGAIYYGCCERLDDRLDVLSKLDKVRKISCSPWSDREHFSEALPDRCVMSAKPNPVFLAGTSFDEDAVRRDLRATIDAAKRHNRNLEFILKDISTIRSDPSRLWRWAQIAMEEVQR